MTASSPIPSPIPPAVAKVPAESSEVAEIELRVYFGGLIAFLPRGPEMSAVLVDVRQPSRLKGTEGIEPHRPVILVDGRYVVPSHDTPPMKAIKDSQGKEKHAWVLDNDVIEIGPYAQLSPPLLEKRLESTAGLTLPVNEVNAESLEWMAPLAGTGSTSPRFKTGVCDPLGAEEDLSSVAAVVMLRRGVLKTAGFASESNRYLVARMGEAPERASALVVELRATVEPRPKADRVELRSVKFDGSPGHALQLKPLTVGDIVGPNDDDSTLTDVERNKKVIEIWVLNLEWEIVKRQRPPRPVRLPESNPEFRFFFDLLQQPLGAPAPPVAVAHRRGALVPGFAPCLDPAMRRLFFPSTSGELVSASACSPTRG
jgi:hypothetical protein